MKSHIVPALILGFAGCKASEETLVVFAASSLTDVFTELEPELERRLGVDVLFNFAGSQTLRVQIEQGAPAQVFASANERHMKHLTGAGLAEEARMFAANELVVVVPRANPAEVHTFADLARAERIVVGAPEVPVGSYTRAMLDQARATIGSNLSEAIEQRVVSRETNVRLVLAKVEMGEADAALVYRTDAASSRRVRTVELPEDVNQRARYYIAPVSSSDDAALTNELIALLLGPLGRDALERHGFSVP